MSSDLMNALKMVADEKSIGFDDLVETIRQAVTYAACKRLNRENLHAKFFPETGEFELYEILENAETVDDPKLHITMDDALKENPDAKPDESICRKVEMEDLGRIAAQSVRIMIHKKGRELEYHRMYLAWRARIGEMVTGRMIKHDDGRDLFELDQVDGILAAEEKLALDRFDKGKHVKFMIIDVEETRREPIVMLSRSHPDLLRKLMEMEVPEMADGIVEIKSLARSHEGRSKVAVCSRKVDVDAVGACVGARGARIQPVAQELGGEKIDILHWKEDPQKLISAALTPAKNLEVIISDKEKKAYVIADDDQLSPAIGKKGVNIRLAVKLTGWELDVMNRKEYDQYLDKTKQGNRTDTDENDRSQELQEGGEDRPADDVQ